MKKAIVGWYIRNFKVLDMKDLDNYDLKFHCNIYGDAINAFNCRSIWLDSKGRSYRCSGTYFFDTKITK